LRASTAYVSFGLIFLAFANVAMAQDSAPVSKEVTITRASPLVVNVPSLPADASAAQPVDRTLPVQLMDVQLSDVFSSESDQKPTASSTPPPKRITTNKQQPQPKKLMVDKSTPQPVKITFGNTPTTPMAQPSKRKPHWSGNRPNPSTLPSRLVEHLVSFNTPYVAPALASVPTPEVVMPMAYVAPTPVSLPSNSAPTAAAPAANTAPVHIAPPLSVAAFVSELSKTPALEKAAAEPMVQPAAVSSTQAVEFAALAPAAGETNTQPAPLVATPTSDVLPAPVAPEPAAAPYVAPIPIEPQQLVDQALAPSKLAATEPPAATAPTLSKESKKTLAKIPSGIDTPKHSKPEHMSINRMNEHASALDEGAAEVKTHEALGIKIEVKRPTLDINYELEKAYSAMVAGQPTVAVEIYRRALEASPNNTQAQLGLAVAYHRAGLLNDARPLYMDILAKDPTNRDALNNFLGLVAEEAPDEALIKLQKLMARNPDFSPIPAQMAVIQQKKGDITAASESMLRAVSLAPENLAYKYNLAVLFDKLGKKEEASSIYSSLLDAYMRGENLGVNVRAIQERLTFLRSNR
jgi:Flp pilus assembly protein TadD